MRTPMKIAILLAMALSGLLTSVAYANLSGAIFTTTSTGSLVNGNIYPTKESVYLDGGPGPNAPQDAAGLPDGWYYFQVTDPPGKTLLSVDPIDSRKFRVEGGIIVELADALVTTRYKGKDYDTHLTGTDIDHGEDGAITIQLMPYSDTPNNGGVYKVWATLVADYQAGQGCFGFIHSKSKTDNYKIKGKEPPCYLKVRKFNDCDADGCWDSGEPEISGWEVILSDEVIDPTTIYTPRCLMLCPGDYQLTEECREHWLQTALFIDGVAQDPVIPNPWVHVGLGETHEVIFGNIELGCITGRKWFDRNGDGEWDEDEPPIEGWRIEICGTDVRGDTYGPDVKETDENGEATWCDLLPGEYTVREIFPLDEHWDPSTPTEVTGTLKSGKSECVDFGNYYTGCADFDTKGYWHNKNGLAELTEADRVYVNGLDPYKEESPYFDDGDEPFDGHFTDGTPVEPAFNNDEVIAPAGSWKAEVSHFLVDANAGSDPCEQLAQQLLAFIFNVRHRLGSNDACIYVNGDWVAAGDLIQQAIDAWNGLPGTDRHAMQTLLDALNNNDAVPFIPDDPPPFVYP